MTTVIGIFNDVSFTCKIQFGSAWWFLDQKDGMIRQINALSNMGLLSRFVGMLTDSRSFLSFLVMNISDGYCVIFSEKKLKRVKFRMIWIYWVKW
jgi:glucuronate isomerase